MLDRVLRIRLRRSDSLNIQIRKIWITDQDTVKVKINYGTVDETIAIDLSNVISHVNIFNANSQNDYELIQGLEVREINTYTGGLKEAVSLFVNGEIANRSQDSYNSPYYEDFSNVPIYFHLDPGETETDDPAGRTIVFPPEESNREWGDRNRRRLTVKARQFVDGLDSGWVDLKSKSRNLAGDTLPNHTITPVEPNVMNLRAYDNVANWMRSLIGYAWQQIAAITSGAEDPPTRESVEALVDDVVNNLTSTEMVEDFFHDHDVNLWWREHQERRIVLANHDKLYTPNTEAVVHDINEKHRTMPVPGDAEALEVNHSNAEEEFHGCVTTDFDKAWKARRRILITERTVTIPNLGTSEPG